MNEGDWICGDANCGNINFARRNSCYRCNKEKPDGGKALKKKLGTEIGKSAAEKSRGLFNADDWQCNKCANVNWARRQTCNVCNAPKFGEVEARTGYGGGYNERGVVEYRRREPSSDDEYDEFGRKKRKRKSETPRSESQEKVGTTEGPVFRKLPPRMLQKGNKVERGPVPAPKYKENEKISGSLSDGSVCEIPLLSTTGFRRNQLQNQTSFYRQDHMMPGYRSNAWQSRKRYVSTGDKDQTGSSGYETSSKRSKHDNSDSSFIKTYNNPVMENRVSSTNNEVIYKFTGPTPAENFQVTYTVEERVKAAAYAIVYNNCKISTEKFESLFDKPAPDFKTIFGWRQRLLTTGCLVDTHSELKKDVGEKSSSSIVSLSNYSNTQRIQAQKMPNPDEIILSLSDSEDDDLINTQAHDKIKSRQRSASLETLIVGGTANEIQGQGSSMCTDQGSRTGSPSRSTHRGNQSSSRDSQDSNYPDTDSELLPSKTVDPRNCTGTNLPARQSVHESDSDSVSYYSDADDFLQRVYKGKKTKRKIKKRPCPAMPTNAPFKANIYDTNNIQTKHSLSGTTTSAPQSISNFESSNVQSKYPTYIPPMSAPLNINETNNIEAKHLTPSMHTIVPHKINNYELNNVGKKPLTPGLHTISPLKTNNYESNREQIYQGYSTVKLSDKNPLVTGNIYTSNLQNMTVKSRDNVVMDIDSCSSEYVPTKLGSTARKNYQEFRDNVRKKGFWAKANGQSINTKSKVPNKPKATCQEKHQNLTPYLKTNVSFTTTTTTTQLPLLGNQDDEFSKDDFTVPLDLYTTFDKPVLPPSPSNTSSIFDMVQLNSSTKNRSIMDIFDTSQELPKSPDKDNDLERYDSVRKMYETEWDDDDEALYKNSDPVEIVPSKKHNPSPPSDVSVGNHSPMSNMLYDQTNETKEHTSTPKKITMDTVRERRDKMLNILKDFQTNRDKEINNSFIALDEINDCSVSQQQTIEYLNSIPVPPPMNSEYLNNIPIPPPKHTSINLTAFKPNAIPADLTNEIINLSEVQENNHIPKTIPPSKRVNIIESVTIDLQDKNKSANQIHTDTSNGVNNMDNHADIIGINNTELQSNDQLQDTHVNHKEIDRPSESIELSDKQQTIQPEIDFSNLLSGINTNTLLLALQNLQQFKLQSTTDGNNQDKQTVNSQNADENDQQLETINLTNDEDWEKESSGDGSIERQLEKMDGNTGDTPFLSDIFDPGPVVMPPLIAKKLNLNLKKPEEKADTNLNENALVIGNFKSFALPKPILLNRLKLTVKTPERVKKSAGGKRTKRKKKGKASTAQDEGVEDDEEEESGDEADLSKYDLWGSDAEQQESKTDAEKSKDGESSKDPADNSVSPETKSKRRSRSSSSSSSSSTSSSSSHSSGQAPKNKFDDFNLNSEREVSPRDHRSRSRSPRSRSANAPPRRKSRDSRSAGESSRSSRDKEWSRDRERRDRSRGNREHKERRYSREGGGNHYTGGRGRHR